MNLIAILVMYRIAKNALLIIHRYYLMFLLFSSYCISCNSGYYLGSESKYCYSCSYACKECTSKSYCTRCDDDYKLDDGDCTVIYIYIYFFLKLELSFDFKKYILWIAIPLMLNIYIKKKKVNQFFFRIFVAISIIIRCIRRMRLK